MNAATAAPSHAWTWRHFLALIAGNVALALGPWSVRLSDAGPVATGFWRLALALPVLALLAVGSGQPLAGFRRGAWLAIAGAGVFFAADLAAWHIGIAGTRLGNASLFGNSGSLILMAWGVIVLRRWPTRGEWLALLAAFAGAAILFGRSLEISTATLVGDLLCLLAGTLYTFYLISIDRARGSLAPWPVLTLSTAAGVLPLLVFAKLLGETVWPDSWWPLAALALVSQLIGQGLLVYAMGHVRPLVTGLGFLLQPVVSAAIGWVGYGEALTPADWIGASAVAVAIVLVRRPAAREAPPAG